MLQTPLWNSGSSARSRFSTGGRRFGSAGRNQRALLALLLLNAGEVVSTDRLSDGLWGAQPPRTASTSLQNAVSQLRKLLGADRVVTKPPGYLVSLAGDDLDTARVLDLVATARTADAEARVAGLREAESLWHGPPLADFAFDSFAQPAIARLEELRLARDRGADRRRARARPPLRSDRRARGAARRAASAGAPPRPVDARPLPVRAPGGRPARLPGGPPRPARATRGSIRARRCSVSTGRSSGRSARWTPSRSSRPPRRASRRSRPLSSAGGSCPSSGSRSPSSRTGSPSDSGFPRMPARSSRASRNTSPS